jgi:hypothetical protein
MKMLLILFSLLLFPLMGHAEECNYDAANTVDQNFTQPLNDASKFSIISAAKDCLLNILNGVWDATAGLAETAWDCLWAPIDCAESGIKAVKNAYHFISNLSEELNKVWSSLKNMTGPQIAELVCGLVGEIGTDVLLAILTGGAASGKLGLTVAKVVLKMQKLGKILGHVVGLPLKILREVSDEVLDNLNLILKRGDKDALVRQLKGSGCAL